jgi:sulfite exporter TauE/SafE
MCGPLVLTLGRGSSRTRIRRVRHAALYQLGRVFTYVALGLATGFVGEALTARGFGRAVAILAGLLLLLAAVRSARTMSFGRLERLGASAATRACVAAGRWSATHPAAGPLLTGAANGLLPCGLVYAALTAAAALGSTGEAAALMAGFGVGTVPALAAVSVSAGALPPSLRFRLRRLAPIVLALAGVLLLVRGVAPSPPGAHSQAPAHAGHVMP